MKAPGQMASCLPHTHKQEAPTSVILLVPHNSGVSCLAARASWGSLGRTVHDEAAGADGVLLALAHQRGAIQGCRDLERDFLRTA